MKTRVPQSPFNRLSALTYAGLLSICLLFSHSASAQKSDYDYDQEVKEMVREITQGAQGHEAYAKIFRAIKDVKASSRSELEKYQITKRLRGYTARLYQSVRENQYRRNPEDSNSLVETRASTVSTETLDPNASPEGYDQNDF